MLSQVVCVRSPLGPVQIDTGPKGVLSVRFVKPSTPCLPKPGMIRSASLRKCARELEEYFKGRRKRFSVGLDLKGTAFQKKVWSEISRVPCGQTITYRELAERVGNERAARAVGSATGSNPACILIPCHRVLSSSGLGGYAYGLAKKKALLDLERTRFPE